MKIMPMVLVAALVVGGGFVYLSGYPGHSNARSEAISISGPSSEIAAEPGVSGNAAAAHLAGYFEALHAEFPPRPDAAANMQGIMDEGTKIARSYFPDNQGKLMRALIQSLTQFATMTPQSWDFKLVSEAGDTAEIVVAFTVGNASMAKIGISNTEVRYSMRREGGNWILMSAETTLQ